LKNGEFVKNGGLEARRKCMGQKSGKQNTCGVWIIPGEQKEPELEAVTKFKKKIQIKINVGKKISKNR
jgi:hypothetical protein